MLVFYDIDSRDKVTWSANTLKTKLAIAHKGLGKREDYRHEYIHYPDIAAVLAEKSFTPIAGHATGYTLPAIEHDGNFVMDSLQIALYLDKAFPDTPPLFPHQSLPLARTNATISAGRAFYPFAASALPKLLDDRDSKDYRDKMNQRYGKDISASSSDEARVDKFFAGTAQDWQLLNDMLGDYEGPFLLGEQRCYADLLIVGFLQWVRLSDKKILTRIMEKSGHMQSLFDACQNIL